MVSLKSKFDDTNKSTDSLVIIENSLRVGILRLGSNVSDKTFFARKETMTLSTCQAILIRNEATSRVFRQTLKPHLRFISSLARLSRWLPETKHEPALPKTEEARRERLRPILNFWGMSHSSFHEPSVLLTASQLTSILELPLPGEPQFEETKPILQSLYTAANVMVEKNHGDKVHYRGLLEFSNICQCDCNYCGIRKSRHQPRFTLNESEIIQAAKWSAAKGYGSIMLQSGEVVTPQRLKLLCKVVRQIVNETDMGVSLSVGELPDEYYQELRQAGAKRYLLRIETSNPILFASLHPSAQTLESRLDRLRALRRCGFMVGTGIMIGLPGQTMVDLANDLLFFKQEDIDMIGMGPYIWQRGTPTGEVWESQHADVAQAYRDREAQTATEEQLTLLDRYGAGRFELSTRMIALARLLCGDVNIAATTALQTLHPTGREIALMRGANILMPILTPKVRRENYQLYEGKVCVDESAKQCRSCLELRVAAAGKRIAYKEHGDPPHAKRRMQLS